MSEVSANRLSKKRSELFLKDFDFPAHKLALYILGLIVSSSLIALIIAKVINLVVNLQSILSGVYIALVDVAAVILALVVMFILVYLLSWNRKNYIFSNGIIKNLLCELQTTSFVFFVWISFVISPPIGMLTGLIFKEVSVYDESTGLTIALFISLIVLFFVGGYRNPAKDALRFAPGTTEDDEFGYKPIAQMDMERVLRSTQHIMVVNINGRLGEGKSSYLRMMVNSKDQKDFLYTYISLTETNETKSFSKLFAERWAETLGLRYPSITNSAKGSLLDNIFRESGQSVLLMARTLFSTARWPLRRTKPAHKGDNYPEEKYIPQAVSSLFSFIPHFKEEYWVVVIDEVERARFDEIYRTIETIERFRIESQWGLPIKLVFVLCTDRIGLMERIHGSAKGRETPSLINSFFEKEPKTIDMHIDLPPIAPDKKQDFIIRIEKEWLIDRYGINVDAIENPDTKQAGDLKVYWPMRMIGASDFSHGRLDDKKAHDFMMRMLLKESPRTIKKVLEETERFLAIFLNIGKRSPDQIRISDLILLHYLKYKHISAIRFLYDVHHKVFSEFYEKFKGEELAKTLLHFEARNANADPMTFEKLFKQETGLDVDKDQLEDIRRIIEVICYPIVEYIDSFNNENAESRYEYSDKPNYDRTLGLPENMWDALTIATENIQDQSTYFVTQKQEIYVHEHKKLPAALMHNGSELLVFARNMRRFYPGDSLVSDYLVTRITEVLSRRRLVRRFPSSFGLDSPYRNLQYQFTLHLANFLDKDEVTDENIDKMHELLQKVMNSKDTTLEAKLTILNSLFVYSRTNNRGALELDVARKLLEGRHIESIKDMVKNVIYNGLDIYLPEGGRSVYDYEENYYYAFYQMWDGDPTNADLIDKIRRVAANGLVHHPKVIGQYWSNRFMTKSQTFVQNAELPITTPNLIEVTKDAKLTKTYQDYIDHWTNDLHEKVEAITPPAENDAFETVRYQLKKLGYLD